MDAKMELHLVYQMQQKFEQSAEGSCAKFEMSGLELVVVQVHPFRVVKVQSTKLTQIKFLEHVTLVIRPASSITVRDFASLGEAARIPRVSWREQEQE